MTKSKRISARLKAETAQKLKRIIAATRSNMSCVIGNAIDAYFAEVVTRQKGNWKALEKFGFIGCARGPRDLSRKYKSYLSESLEKKI